MCYDLITLPNGLRIVGDRIDHFRSVSVGLWLGVGSQFEAPAEAGLSHFLEHMVFKGTRKRTARQIAEAMDAVGGQLNAFTAKSCTCFYAKVVDEDLRLAMDVLADLVTAPAFAPEELEKEKGVVLEEISMAGDDPEDVVAELLMQSYFGDQPLSRPILGTAERIQGYRSEDLRRYWSRMYRPQNAVLSVCGHYDWEAVKALAAELLGDWPAEGLEKPPCVSCAPKPRLLTREKDIEQVHICMGFPGVPLGDVRNYEVCVFNAVYGGAMSSRLFQKIREESGMAYNVYSFSNGYSDCGMLGVYAATNPDTACAVIDMILAETRRLAGEGMTRREFEMAREQWKASYIMGMESTTSRMQTTGRRLLELNEIRSDDEIIANIEKIDYDSANRLMRELLTAPNATALVGKDIERIASKL